MGAKSFEILRFFSFLIFKSDHFDLTDASELTSTNFDFSKTVQESDEINNSITPASKVNIFKRASDQNSYGY